MKDIFNGLEERFEILNDIPKYCPDVHRVGYAYRREWDEHYLLRLNTLPGMKFYLYEQKNGQKVIYSGKSKNSFGIRFFNSAGIAEEISDDILKLKFSTLNIICYLRLSPKDFHYLASVA